VADLSVELREIRDADVLTGLKLGDADFQPLKTFLQRDAKKFHASDLAKTYALFIPLNGREKVIAYITLICAEIATSDAGEVNGNGVKFTYSI
jgi:hypothetical protein